MLLRPKHLLVAGGVVSSLYLAGCGGGSSSPTQPNPPGTTTGTLAITLFYDENGNGQIDPSEVVRLTEVVVSVAGVSGRTAAGSGTTVLSGLPEGTHTVTVDTSTLPPFYQAPAPPIPVQVPQQRQVAVPCTLPIGANRPNTYLAFGNSITDGFGHTDGMSYRGRLQSELVGFFGAAEVINDGIGSTSSEDGAARISASLLTHHPAYTLIHYGTNDFNKSGCRRVETIDECFTIPSLRTIVRATLAAGSLPCLATILPSNTGFDWRAPPQRNQWIALQDERIRAMAAEEGALLVDLEAAFLQAGPLDTLFEDHVHPNAAGFELMADTFFEAIAHGQTPAAFVPVGGRWALGSGRFAPREPLIPGRESLMRDPRNPRGR